MGLGLGVGVGVGVAGGAGVGVGVGIVEPLPPPQLAIRTMSPRAAAAVASFARRFLGDNPKTTKRPTPIINTAAINPVPPDVTGGAAPAAAVVVTVRVTFTGTLFAGVTVEGENVQLAPAGRPVQAKPVAKLKPPDGITVRV